MKKTEKIVELSVNKSAKRKREVMTAINNMKRRGDNITFYSVMKLTGASKSYLYGNIEIRALIEKERNEVPKPRNNQSNKVIISAQLKKIEELTSMIRKLEAENNDSYKAKYESVKAENIELKKQIRAATYNF